MQMLGQKEFRPHTYMEPAHEIARFRSKADLDSYLRVEGKPHGLITLLKGQFLLPKKGRYNKEFLKQVLAGTKVLLRRMDTRLLEVPQYKELSYLHLKDDVYGDPALAKYFPDPQPGQREVDRDYFFTVLSTLRGQWLQENIQHARKIRNSADPEEEKDQVVVVTEEMFQFLHEHPFQSSKWLATNPFRVQWQDDAAPQGRDQAKKAHESRSHEATWQAMGQRRPQKEGQPSGL